MVYRLILDNRRFRSILSLCVALVLIALVSFLGTSMYRSSQAATDKSIYLTPDSGTVQPGSKLSVTLRANSGNEPVNSVQVSLSFDDAQLQFVSISEGGSFPTVAATSTDTPGIIRVSRAAQAQPVSGDNAVLTINFEVLGSAGNADIVVDKAYSFMVRSTDNQDVLDTVRGSSFVLTPSSSPKSSSLKPVFYLSPPTNSVAIGSEVSIAVRINTNGVRVSTVQPVITYPADKLQYVSVSDEGGAFTTKQRTLASAGKIDLIRGVPGGSGAIQGDQLVATLKFKVVGTSGQANAAIANGSGAYDDSGSGQNVLDLESSTGGVYSIESTPDPLPAGSGNSGGSSVTSPAQSISVSSSIKDGQAALAKTSDGSVVTEVKGRVEFTPIIDQSLLNGDTAVTITKVEYYLDKDLIATEKTAPYKYVFDSRSLRNGVYTILIKTYLSNGQTDTRTDKLQVNNPVNMSYVVRHYLATTLTALVTLAVAFVLGWKYIRPRASRLNMAGGIDPESHRMLMDQNLPVADEPTIVAPLNKATADTTTFEPVPTPEVASLGSLAPPQPQVLPPERTDFSSVRPEQPQVGSFVRPAASEPPKRQIVVVDGEPAPPPSQIVKPAAAELPLTSVDPKVS